jgi:molybdopterin-guanine dinucleotide biosynthesis protein A
VLPFARGHAQPLAAAYSPSLAARAARLVAAGRLRPSFLLDECHVLRLDDDALLSTDDEDGAQLRAADPDLDSVINLNGPDDYIAAHARPAPSITVECFGVMASDHGRGARTVRAATVAGAAEAAGVSWDRHVLAAVNGDHTGRDGEQALVAGDTVAFLSAAAGG